MNHKAPTHLLHGADLDLQDEIINDSLHIVYKLARTSRRKILALMRVNKPVNTENLDRELHQIAANFNTASISLKHLISVIHAAANKMKPYSLLIF